MLVSGRVSFEMISLSNPAPSGSGFILSRGPLRLRKKNTGEVAKKTFSWYLLIGMHRSPNISNAWGKPQEVSLHVRNVYLYLP